MLKATIEDSFKRLIEPSIDREIRSDLTEKAEEQVKYLVKMLNSYY